MLEGGFDGFYTYFATDGFTFVSTTRNWPKLAAWARAHAKIFVPCAAPGYIDTRIRPWNGVNTRDREGGAYYDRSWVAAVAVSPELVGTASFNEWREGTQIETATRCKRRWCRARVRTRGPGADSTQNLDGVSSSEDLARARVGQARDGNLGPINETGLLTHQADRSPRSNRRPSRERKIERRSGRTKAVWPVGVAHRRRQHQQEGGAETDCGSFHSW